jgi:uncharacterized protein (TIGR02246 family)
MRKTKRYPFTNCYAHVVPVIASLMATVAIGCVPSTLDSRAPDPAELMEADRVFSAETQRIGGEAWVTAFAEDGRLLIPGGEVRGREAIGEIMVPAFAQPGFSLSWEPQFADVGSGGDLGYTVGHYIRQVVSAEGDTTRSEGTYTTVWKRGEDGVWRAVLDLGVPDPDPVPEAPEPEAEPEVEP